MLTLFGIQLPTFASFASSTGEYSSGFFTEMLPFAYFILGFTIGATLLSALIGWIAGAIAKIGARKRPEPHLTTAGTVDYHTD